MLLFLRLQTPEMRKLPPLPPSIQDRPEKEGSNVMDGMYNILSENIENYDHFIVNNLKMTNNAMGEVRHRPTPKMRRS